MKRTEPHKTAQQPLLICRIFAIASRLRWRVKAAAQHSSSELGSAFALHFSCNVGGYLRDLILELFTFKCGKCWI